MILNNNPSDSILLKYNYERKQLIQCFSFEHLDVMIQLTRGPELRWTLLLDLEGLSLSRPNRDLTFIWPYKKMTTLTLARKSQIKSTSKYRTFIYTCMTFIQLTNVKKFPDNIHDSSSVFNSDSLYCSIFLTVLSKSLTFLCNCWYISYLIEIKLKAIFPLKFHFSLITVLYNEMQMHLKRFFFSLLHSDNT